MPFADGCELIRYAMDAEAEDRLFFRWCLGYQTQMGFEEFKSALCPDSGAEDDRGAEEILETVKGIIG